MPIEPDRGTRHSRFKRLEWHLGGRVASGFLVLVPVFVTVLIFGLFVGYVDKVFRPLVDGTILDYPGVGLVVGLVILYLMGSFFSGDRSRAIRDAILTRIPVVGKIYTVASQITEALSSPMDRQFTRVVFLDWPRSGVRSMGFVTGHSEDTGLEGKAELRLVVYIPTVPNPTSGMLVWVHEKDVIDSGFGVEEAMKIVFSGGIVLPRLDETNFRDQEQS